MTIYNLGDHRLDFYVSRTKKARIISRYLDTNGDGTGTKQAVGDYSGAAEQFKIVPAAGQVMVINRMLVYVEDGSGIDSSKYGNTEALTNGITLAKENGSGVVDDLTDGLTIKTLAQWIRVCYDGDPKVFGTGNESFTVRWTFAKASALRLDGDLGEFFSVTVNDDFSGTGASLADHTFMAQGYYSGDYQ